MLLQIGEGIWAAQPARNGKPRKVSLQPCDRVPYDEAIFFGLGQRPADVFWR